MGGAGPVGADQQLPPVSGRDLSDGRGQDGDVVGGGVRAGVPGAQHQRQRFLGVVAPETQRVVAEALLERRSRTFLPGVRRDQGGVDVEDDGVTEIGVSDPRGGEPVGQLGPDVRADRRPRFVDPFPRCGGDLVQGPPHRRRGRDRSEDLALVAQDVDVGDRLTAAGDQDRDIDQDPTPVVRRDEPPPSQGPGQRAGQADLVRQQPGRDVPGVGHDPGAVRGDRQRRGPRPTCPASAGNFPTRPACGFLRGSSRCTLHLRGAFHSSLLNPRQVQHRCATATFAFSGRVSGHVP